MLKILDSSILYIKIIFRSAWMWLVLILNIVYLIACLNEQMGRGAGNMLHFSSYSLAVLMLLFMVIGFYISNMEAESGCEETLISMPEAKMSKFLSKLVVIIFLSFFITFICGTIYYISFSKISAEAYFYQNAWIYLILYWIIPFIICGFIGIIVGNFIKSKWAYLIIILFWIILSCLNTLIFEFLSNLFKVDLYTISSILNLIQSDIQVSYNSLYGLPLEKMRWMRNLIILLVLAYIITILYVKEIVKNKKIVISIVSVLFIVSEIFFINSFLKASIPKIDNYCKYSNKKFDRLRYKNIQGKAIEGTKNFKINSYDIKLDCKNKLKAEVLMDIDIFKPPYDEIVMNLYNNFKVSEMKMGNRDLSYIQSGEQIKVKIPKENLRDKLQILIKYSGDSSPIFYANEQGAFLTYFFPWLPSNKAYDFCIFNNNKLGLNINYSEDEALYRLEFDSDKEVFTNIEKKDDGIWEGRSSSGLSLVCGNIHKEVLDNEVKLYYTDTGVSKKFYEDLYKGTVEVINNLENIFNFNRSIDIKNIVYVPMEMQPFGINNKLVTYSKDTVIMASYDNIHDSLKPNLKFSDEYKADIVRGTTIYLLQKKNFVMQEGYIKNLFVNSFEYWYINKYNLHARGGFTSYKKDKNKNIKSEEEIEKMYNLVQDFLQKNLGDEEKIYNFYREFFKLLDSEKKATSNDVIQLTKVGE